MSRKTKKNIKQIVQPSKKNKFDAINSLEHALRLDGCGNNPNNLVNGDTNVDFYVLTQQFLELTYLYKQYGVLEKIVNIPVDDAYKASTFEYASTLIDDEELDQLKNFVKRKQLISELKKAQKWARLYGGAALILLVEGDDFSQPLDYKSLHDKEVNFLAVDRWRLTYSLGNINIPGGFWTLNTEEYEGVSIHCSRVAVLHGAPAPYVLDLQVQGWGLSAYESIFRDLTQMFKAQNTIFEFLDEAKIDILKLEAFDQALSSSAGEQALQKTVDFVAANKNYKSMITLPLNDQYEQKQLTFSGLEGMLKEIRIAISGAACIPVNKLWGEGITGFGSGQDSLENYNSLIENQIRVPAEPVLDWIHKICCWHLFGVDVEDLTYTWEKLRVLSSIDEQNIADHKISNLLALYDRKLLTPQELMEALKTAQLFVQDTEALQGKLDTMPLFPQDSPTITKLEDISVQ